MGPSVAYSMKVLPSVKKTQNSSNARWNQDILTGIARIFAIWMETLPAKIDQFLLRIWKSRWEWPSNDFKTSSGKIDNGLMSHFGCVGQSLSCCFEIDFQNWKYRPTEYWGVNWKYQRVNGMVYQTEWKFPHDKIKSVSKFTSNCRLIFKGQ